MDAMRPALEAFKDTALPDIDRTLIEQLMKQLMQASVKPVTVRNRLSVLRTVLRWCAEKGYRELHSAYSDNEVVADEDFKVDILPRLKSGDSYR